VNGEAYMTGGTEFFPHERLAVLRRADNIGPKIAQELAAAPGLVRWSGTVETPIT
jgi:hypothetical protein